MISMLMEAYLSLAVGWWAMEIMYLFIWVWTFQKELREAGTAAMPDRKIVVLSIVIPIVKSLIWPFPLLKGSLRITIQRVKEEATTEARKFLAFGSNANL